MATQGQRQDFLWRPNTNDSTTLARYSQEARHWTRAVNEARREANRKPFQDSVTVIGLVLSLIVNLIWLIVLACKQIFKLAKW